MTLPRVPFGTTGVDISRVGLGTWQMGGPSDRGWGAQDDEESIGAIRRAVAAGANWLDTAPAYGGGHSHAVVGRALRPLPEAERPYVFTKCGIAWVPGAKVPRRVLEPVSLRRECDATLEALGVERLDLLQIHWPVDGEGVIEAAWSTLVDLSDAGKVRWIGVSNFDEDQLGRCEAIRHVDSAQPALSLLDRDSAEAVIPWCAAHGTAALVYSPLQSGLLTGRFSRERLKEGDWRIEGRNMRRAGHSHFHDPWLGQNLALVERLAPVAERLGCSVLALAIAWTLAWPGVTAAIVGARNAGQVDGWLPAAGVALADGDLDEIAVALADTRAGLGVPATRRPAGAAG